MPHIQKYIIRIIVMIPIYSIESWCSLRFHFISIYLQTLREIYESYVIYSFFYFLISLLGNESKLITILKLKSKEKLQYLYPFNLCCCSNWEENSQFFLYYCKLGVFQYVIYKNISLLCIFILMRYNLYHEDSFSFLSNGYIYIYILSNISQLWALYSLTMFYFIFKEELLPWKPFGKFLSVKLVIY